MAVAAQQQAAASVLQSFPFRAAVLALCVALLPLLPTQAPDAAGGGGGAGQAFLAKAWELLHLLFVGIAVSYGLFSRKNSADDDGRAGAAAAAAAAAAARDKDDAAAAGPAEPAAKADARYAWRMFRDSIAPFDDDDDDFHDDVRLPDSPPTGGGGGGRGARASSWSALHRPVEPVVVVSTGGGGVRIGQAADAQAPLSLPVRALKPQQQQAQDAADAGDDDVETPRARPRRRSSRDSAAAGDETVLPSPIPWRSRCGSGRRLDDDARRPTPSPSPSPSPKRLSPASSLSRETQTTLAAKATDEEYYAKAKRRTPYRSSSISSSSSPPAPPPPPPPFLVHGYHRATERRSAAARSFKEELQHHSMRGGRGEDHYSPRTSSFSNFSPAKARSSFDGSGSSSSSVSVGKSVRTFRAREPAVFQDQSQELPDDDDAGVGDGRDARLDVHGSEEPYGYRDYQSIPRFQYERSGSDPILGGVAVSSDETESSDDDGDDGDVGGGGGGYTTRESSPEVDENEVDKKAEEFIARFREQIRRQRIESIKKSAGPRGVKHHGK